jgi:hypothetical protein
VCDKLAPLLPVAAAIKILGVVLDCLPGQEQPVTAGLLDRALQRHRLTAFGALEQRRGLGDASFELGLLAGLDIDLRDFENHVFSASMKRSYQKPIN